MTTTSRTSGRGRPAAACVAAGAALAVLCSAGTAHAGFYVSLQTHSNVRPAPHTNSGTVVNTGAVKDRFYLDGVCYSRGQYIKSGGYGTDVWYRGSVHDSVDLTTGPYNDVWVWGGNVDIGRDPSDSVRPC
ncbi:hypothetical protein ACIOKD_36155 [Streptomyces sp. NPDC087844]|uniref:hypothetical protein n=1 Tax=Streptomyces sp. NPDC087844 TaxID=3365805 RepID=UPI0037FAAC16